MHKVERVTQKLWGYTFFPISSRQQTLSFTLGTRNCWQRVPNTRGRHEIRIWPRSLKAMNFSLLCYFFDGISSRKWCISSVLRFKTKDIRLTLTIFSFVSGNCLLTQRGIRKFCEKTSWHWTEIIAFSCFREIPLEELWRDWIRMCNWILDIALTGIPRRKPVYVQVNEKCLVDAMALQYYYSLKGQVWKLKSKKQALTKRTEVIKTLAERRHCQQIDCDLSAIRSCIDYSEDNWIRQNVLKIMRQTKLIGFFSTLVLLLAFSVTIDGQKKTVHFISNP